MDIKLKQRIRRLQCFIAVSLTSLISYVMMLHFLILEHKEALTEALQNYSSSVMTVCSLLSICFAIILCRIYIEFTDNILEFGKISDTFDLIYSIISIIMLLCMQTYTVHIPSAFNFIGYLTGWCISCGGLSFYAILFDCYNHRRLS